MRVQASQERTVTVEKINKGMVVLRVDHSPPITLYRGDTLKIVLDLKYEA